jgi:hypothetical protein
MKNVFRLGRIVGSLGRLQDPTLYHVTKCNKVVCAAFTGREISSLER